MADTKNISMKMVNELDEEDSLSSTIFENPDVPSVNHLVVNWHDPNLVVPSENFGCGKGYIESVDGALNASTKGSTD